MIKTCVTLVLLNISNLPLNQQDYKTIARASYVCGEKSGCLKVFQKREQGVYRVLCGKKQDLDRKAIDIAEINGIIDESKALGESEEVLQQKLKSLGVKSYE